MSQQSLSKLVVVVTGASHGIGKAACLYLLNRGYRVTAADINKSNNELFRLDLLDDCSTREDAKYTSDDFLVLDIDVSDESQVSSMVEQTVSRFGRLDVLINNAAIAKPYHAPVEELKLEEWNRFMSINVNSLFLCSKYAIPHLKQTRGSIINVSSTRSLMSEPDSEAYSTSKGAVLAFTHSLANSVGPKYGIRVNAISPGWIDTSDNPSSLREVDHAQHLVGRVGVPDDIAHTIEYLIGAQFVTGQNIVVDGGMTKKMIYHE